MSDCFTQYPNIDMCMAVPVPVPVLDRIYCIVHICVKKAYNGLLKPWMLKGPYSMKYKSDFGVIQITLGNC